MITELLLKKFVPELKEIPNKTASAVAVIVDQDMRKKIGTLGSATGMVLNLLLSAMKMLLGFLMGSVAVTADGVNNLSDAGGSLVALISVR
ncbi:MAG: cation transporter, partial [Clostridia bacterium]|nr:cation transporter [Clostridia bacterium]